MLFVPRNGKIIVMMKCRKLLTVLCLLALVCSLCACTRATLVPVLPTESADTKIFEIKSNSMSPEIVRGDTVVIRKCTAAELQVGDIIAMRPNRNNENSLLVHRVIHICKRGELPPNLGGVAPGEDGADEIWIKTRGDNADMDDPPFPESMLYGIVVDVIRTGNRA